MTRARQRRGNFGEREEHGLKKRLVAMAACIAMLCSGCQVFFPGQVAPTPTPDKSDTAPARYASEYENKWCYERLSEPLRECYAALYEAVMDNRYADTRITVYKEDAGDTMDSAKKVFPGVRVALPRYLESEKDAKQLYQAFTWDNPQFFFLSNDYYYEGYRNDKTGALVCRSICLPFNSTPEERRKTAKKLEQAGEEMLKDLPSGDDFSVERALHDRMLAACRYHAKAGESHDIARYPNAFTAVGALVDGQAVCEGYARGMQYLLQRAGIECSLVTGINEKNEPHMWNLVTINGRNYHLDPTWDDVDDRIRYTFFNVTTDSITRTHTIDADIIGVDTCTATQDNYYRRTGHYIDSFARDDLDAVIARDMSAGETMIDLQFSPATFVNAQLLISNQSLLFDLVRRQLPDEDAPLWEDYDARENTVYYTVTLYQKKKDVS